MNRLICDLLECGPKPTVAAIEGMALGGGLEVAMGCNARVCAPGEVDGRCCSQGSRTEGCVWCGVVVVLGVECGRSWHVWGARILGSPSYSAVCPRRKL